MIPISVADILTALDHISEVWRSDTAVERRTDLADLDDLLARLEDMEPQTSAETERIEELCGRTPITTEDLDTDPRTRGLNPSMPPVRNAMRSRERPHC